MQGSEDGQMEADQEAYLEAKTMPGDDEVRTWHVHDNESWQWGVSCWYCKPDEYVAEGKTVHFNIYHLRQQTREGWNVKQKQKEIEDGARRDGRDITRV